MAKKYWTYEHVALADAKLPKEKGTYPEAESGINICLHKLGKDDMDKGTVLFNDVTVDDLTKVLKSAHGFIDHAKYEFGEVL